MTESQYKVDNAIIMAAGMSSRFVPLSFELPKALLKVKGDILIERQIKQLKEAKIEDITIVVGYKKELFYYLNDKYQVKIVENPEYSIRNNNSSLYYVRDRLKNTYICSADNYFTKNVFRPVVSQAYYSAVFEEGDTKEWCIEIDETGLIKDVKVGGKDSWAMLGHAFFTRNFSEKFVEILEQVYEKPETAQLFWEDIYINNINDLPMYIKKFPKGIIFEFDTLDELRMFDKTYCDNTGSNILKKISSKLNCNEGDIIGIMPIKNSEETIGFDFMSNGKSYSYNFKTKEISIK